MVFERRIMSREKNAKVFYADVYGLREEKYRYLLKNDIKTTKWKKLHPKPPYYWFVEKDLSLEEEYEKFWKVTEIFKKQSSGITTHRDHFVVGFTKGKIIQQLRIFTGELTDELVSQNLNLKDTGTWKLAEARQKVKIQNVELLQNKIYSYAYRPFDARFICYEPILINRPRLPFMKNLLMENLSLALVRILSKLPFYHAFVSECLTNRELVSIRTKERTYVFPLYLYPEESQERISNFTSRFQEFIKTLYPKKGISPEGIFSYIYAVLYSPAYRKRYAEFLKIDFPRIPFTKDYRLLKRMAELGKDLIDLHLLKSEKLKESIVKYPISGTDMVKKVRYEKGRVYINDSQYFEGIPEEIWEYRIGSYQVLQKWLKDRKDHRLSLDDIRHYLKITTAIKQTIKVQERIDKVYGGSPSYD